MCYIKREYKINTRAYVNNDFINLWYCIASQFKFIKLTFKKKYTEQEINFIITNHNLTEFTKYEIIWKNDIENIILLINKSYDFGKIFVVVDSCNSNRYFIGFSYNGINNIEYVSGLFLYFSNQSNTVETISLQQSMNNMVISSSIFAAYNKSNMQINSKNSSLYNQTLLFVQVDPENNNLTFTINYLNYYDEIQYQSLNFLTNYQTDIKIFNSLKHSIYPRFFYFEDTYKYGCFIDLGSLSLIPKSNNLKLITYTTKEPVDFIKLSGKFEIEYYGDDYPSYCTKCNMKTMIANVHHQTNKLINLGRSYCFNCLMRYSIKSKCWLCCKLDKDYNLCNQHIMEKECTNTHVEYNFTCQLIRTFNKHPNRDEIIIY